jgi:hypothetical protein
MELFKVAKNLYAQTSAACVAYVKGVKAKDLKAANVAKEAFTKIQADKREFQGADRLEKVLKQIILAPLSLALRICLLAMNHKIAKQPVAVAPAAPAPVAPAPVAPKAPLPPEASLVPLTAEEEALQKLAAETAIPADAPLPPEAAVAPLTAEEEAAQTAAAAVALPSDEEAPKAEEAPEAPKAEEVPVELIHTPEEWAQAFSLLDKK